MANFWETENAYTAILYEKRPDENYFKIKAIAKNNSSNIVNQILLSIDDLEAYIPVIKLSTNETLN